MASLRPSSPRPVTPKKDEKDESFWDKFGTIGRKKKIKEGEYLLLNQYFLLLRKMQCPMRETESFSPLGLSISVNIRKNPLFLGIFIVKIIHVKLNLQIFLV